MGKSFSAIFFLHFADWKTFSLFVLNLEKMNNLEIKHSIPVPIEIKKYQQYQY